MSAPYDVVLHPLSIRPSKGDVGVIAIVTGTQEHLFCPIGQCDSEGQPSRRQGPPLYGMRVGHPTPCEVMGLKPDGSIAVKFISRAALVRLMRTGVE